MRTCFVAYECEPQSLIAGKALVALRCIGADTDNGDAQLITAVKVHVELCGLARACLGAILRVEIDHYRTLELSFRTSGE
jgi:hypothetical protein